MPAIPNTFTSAQLAAALTALGLDDVDHLESVIIAPMDGTVWINVQDEQANTASHQADVTG